MESEKSIYKYFRIGDIVLDYSGSIWGNMHFRIESFHGNWYLPLAYVQQVGYPETNKYKCNFDIRDLRLIGAERRPLRKIEQKSLIRLMSRGIMEAKREFFIRKNIKEMCNCK